jgi:hypothetical protein
MKNFAVIDSDNTIINLIIAESIEIAEGLTGKTCIEYDLDETLLDLTWSFDGENFIAPEPVEQIPNDEVIITDDTEPEPGFTRPE